MTATPQPRPPRCLVLGFGNTLRGDDAAGPLLAERVAARAWPGVVAQAVPQLTPELAAALAEYDAVVFADARRGGDAVTLVPLAPAAQLTGAALGHPSDPRWLLALAAAVYGARPVAWLLTLPGREFALGAALSAATRAALEVAERQLGQWLGQSGQT